MNIKRFERKLEKIEKRPSKHHQRFEAIRIRYIAYQLECYFDDKEIDEENSAVKAYRQAEKDPRFRKHLEEIEERTQRYAEENKDMQTTIDKYLEEYS